MIKLSLLAAVAENGVIGYQEAMPWPRIPDDMKRFVETTKENMILVGNTTYRSMLAMGGERIFRHNREYLVMTKKSITGIGISHPQVRMFNSIEGALGYAEEKGREKVIVAGGQKVYEQTIEHSLAHELLISKIHLTPPGDTYFPNINPDLWDKVADDRVNEMVSFLRYVRK